MERRQVFGLPPMTVRVTEHQLIARRCACGITTCGTAPAGVTAPVQHGPRITAIIVYLYVGQFLSKKRTATALAELFGTPVSAAVVVALARAGELVCESVVKVLVARPRPALVDPVAHASGCSFPSGHAGGSAAVYGALALLGVVGVARWARLMLVTAAALLVGAVAVSRVLLGVHYPSDVAAGVALGLAWVSAAALLVSLPRSARTPTSVPNRSVPPTG